MIVMRIRTHRSHSEAVAISEIGVIGLAVMGQNLALNIADKGFPVSVYNRSYEKTELAQQRATKEGTLQRHAVDTRIATSTGLGDAFSGFKDLKDFVASLKRPRHVWLHYRLTTFDR